MAEIDVRAVTDRRSRRAFLDFPYQFYRDDPFFVPPLRIEVGQLLNSRKNPFFDHGSIQPFVAYDRAGNVVGRIAAIVNGMHLEKYDDGVGFFGFFDCIDDQDVADALFSAVGDWLRERGLDVVRGPANPSMNDVAGLLVDGFEAPPSVLMAYNPPYYRELLERHGFQRVATMWAFFIHRKYANMERLRRGVQLVHRRNPGLTIRNVDMARFMDEASLIREIYNDAWSSNWGHVPMTEAEFVHLAKGLKQVVDPRMAYILELHGTPIGFSVAIPNINQVLRTNRKGRLFPTGLLKLLLASRFGGIQEVRLPLLGVRKEFQGRGFDAVLILESGERIPPIGFPSCEMSWVLDNNPSMVNALEALGGIREKEYALFERALDA